MLEFHPAKQYGISSNPHLFQDGFSRFEHCIGHHKMNTAALFWNWLWLPYHRFALPLQFVTGAGCQRNGCPASLPDHHR